MLAPGSLALGPETFQTPESLQWPKKVQRRLKRNKKKKKIIKRKQHLFLLLSLKMYNITVVFRIGVRNDHKIPKFKFEYIKILILLLVN